MVLGIRYLTGYCVAKDLTRQEPEWPPHPARVFMALSAAHFETGADPSERQGLLWLESQPAPKIYASGARQRSFVESYVPVNDQHGGIIKRPRQSRSFPTMRPDEATIFLFWPADPEPNVLSSIKSLCQKVTRIGHSYSLTQVWISQNTLLPAANWEPAEEQANHRMRVPEKGLLTYLERSFNGEAIRHYSQLTEALLSAKGKAKNALKEELKHQFGDHEPQATKPTVDTWSGYRHIAGVQGSTSGKANAGPFDPDFIVLSKFEGRTLGLESTLQVTLALRDALLKVCPQPQPEWLTGHAPDGSPSKQPHVAMFPLPFVGAKHADGHVMGLGIAIPKGNLAGDARTRQEALRKCVGPLFFDPDTGKNRQIRLWKNSRSEEGKAWEWLLARELREEPPQSLKQSAWSGPSHSWASVTPVVLHHFPKKAPVMTSSASCARRSHQHCSLSPKALKSALHLPMWVQALFETFRLSQRAKASRATPLMLWLPLLSP